MLKACLRPLHHCDPQFFLICFIKLNSDRNFMTIEVFFRVLQKLSFLFTLVPCKLVNRIFVFAILFSKNCSKTQFFKFFKKNLLQLIDWGEADLHSLHFEFFCKFWISEIWKITQKNKFPLYCENVHLWIRDTFSRIKKETLLTWRLKRVNKHIQIKSWNQYLHYCLHVHTGADWLHKFWSDFFQESPKKNCHDGGGGPFGP
jgi:hypothetical protein